MKRLLAVTALSLAWATPAWAGFGTTAAVGSGMLGTSAPTLDYRASPVLVQIHALDLLAPLMTGGEFYLNTGVDVTYVAVKQKVGPEVEGVFMPGGGLGINTMGDTNWYIIGEGRVGAEMKAGMGFGMYVVPYLGVTDMVRGDVGLLYGGSVQVSAWFN